MKVVTFTVFTLLVSVVLLLSACTGTPPKSPKPYIPPELVSAEEYSDGELTGRQIEDLLTGKTLFGIGEATGDRRVNYRYQLAFKPDGIVFSGDREVAGTWSIVENAIHISIPGWRNSTSIAKVFVSNGKVEFRSSTGQAWLTQY